MYGIIFTRTKINSIFFTAYIRIARLQASLCMGRSLPYRIQATFPRHCQKRTDNDRHLSSTTETDAHGITLLVVTQKMTAADCVILLMVSDKKMCNRAVSMHFQRMEYMPFFLMFLYQVEKQDRYLLITYTVLNYY